jgi:hypothetical protein
VRFDEIHDNPTGGVSQTGVTVEHFGWDRWRSDTVQHSSFDAYVVLGQHRRAELSALRQLAGPVTE